VKLSGFRFKTEELEEADLILRTALHEGFEIALAPDPPATHHSSSRRFREAQNGENRHNRLCRLDSSRRRSAL
jgi:hypothetical protein